MIMPPQKCIIDPLNRKTEVVVEFMAVWRRHSWCKRRKVVEYVALRGGILFRNRRYKRIRNRKPDKRTASEDTEAAAVGTEGAFEPSGTGL